MNVLDWLPGRPGPRLRRVRLLAGLHHRRLRHRRAAARRPVRHLAGPDGCSATPPRRCWVSLAALFVVLVCASLGQARPPVRRRADPRPDHLAAGPGPRRDRRRRAERGRRAGGRLGARRRGQRLPASPGITPQVRELHGARPRSTGDARRTPAGAAAPSTTWSASASSRATSSRSRPSGSSTSGPAPGRVAPRPGRGPGRAQRAQDPRRQLLRPRASRAPASSTRPTG